MYLFARERACMQQERAEGEEERESSAGSTFSTEADAELDVWALRSQPEHKPGVRCSTNRDTPAPQHGILFQKIKII